MILKDYLKSSRVNFNTLINEVFENHDSLLNVDYFSYPNSPFPSGFHFSTYDITNKFHKSKLPDLAKVGFIVKHRGDSNFSLTAVGEQYRDASSIEEKLYIIRTQILLYKIEDNIYPYWIFLYFIRKFSGLTNHQIEQVLSLTLTQLKNYEIITLSDLNTTSIIGSPHYSYILSYLNATNLFTSVTVSGQKRIIIKDDCIDHVNNMLAIYPNIELSDDSYNTAYTSTTNCNKIYDLLIESNEINGNKMLDLATINMNNHNQVKSKLEQMIIDNKFFTDDLDTLISIVAALSTGHHIILYGPVGTGKTELVRTLIYEFFGNSIDIVTAGEDWDSPDYLVGSYQLIKGEIKFIKGPLINSIEKDYQLLLNSISKSYESNDFSSNNWLLIDEINRGDVNRYLSNLMTALEPLRKNLSKKDLEDKYKITYNTNDEGKSNHIIMPRSFRIIGTMNTYDKNVLYKLPFALKGRRFALIDVNPPQNLDREITIINKILNDEGVYSNTYDSLLSLLKDFMKGLRQTNFRIGTAIFLDIGRMAIELKYLDNTIEDKKVMDLSLSVKFIPLLDDLAIDMQEEIVELLDTNDYTISKDKLNELIGEFEI